ncbi:MAG: SRPBCC family protein [Sporichthyaceae bacterium]
MTITDIRKDPETLTMTITTDHSAPVEKVWSCWADPRRLERWWGPPGYPATFVDHDLRAGGRASYFMTSPEGEKYHGWWEILVADAPHRIEIRDGFADDAGNPNPDMPETSFVVTLTATDAGTRMQIASAFPSTEAMEQLLAMGMDEGMSAALGQLDALLTEA